VKTGKHIIGIILLLAVTLAGTLSACAPGPKNGDITSAITVTDQIGRTVTISSTPMRIVSLAPSNTEILYALGLGDRAVGRTDFDNYPPEVTDKPSIGGFSTTNIEEVVALNPDLVLAADYHKDDVVPALEQRGITVLCLAPQNLQQVLDAITLTGKVTGTDKTAADLVASMQKRIDAVESKVKNLTAAQRPRTMYIVWPDPIMVGAGNTLQGELITAAGGTNIAQDLDSYATVSLETILADNPQVMIASTGMGEGADAGYQFLLTDARLGQTDARENGQVYSVDQDTVSRAGPRIVDALEAFAADIHPELFGSGK
jgi:iron complex transport system substrate-binding protein